MEKLITVKDVCHRYGCSLPTARKYMRQMFHYENPLTVPGWAFNEWEKQRERMPDGISRHRAVQIRHLKDNGRTVVPRKR